LPNKFGSVWSVDLVIDCQINLAVWNVGVPVPIDLLIWQSESVGVLINRIIWQNLESVDILFDCLIWQSLECGYFD
jgi:hypothetical protein